VVLTPLERLLDSLTGFERGLCKVLQLEGAQLTLADDKLVLAFAPFLTDEGHRFYKSFERLPDGHWQQVFSLDIGDYVVKHSTQLEWEEPEPLSVLAP